MNTRKFVTIYNYSKSNFEIDNELEELMELIEIEAVMVGIKISTLLVGTSVYYLDLIRKVEINPEYANSYLCFNSINGDLFFFSNDGGDDDNGSQFTNIKDALELVRRKIHE